MADLSKVEAALIKADAAGDVEGARILAGEVRRLRGMGTDAPSKPEPVKQSSIKDFLKPELPYGDIAAGAIKGATDIGATLLSPIDALGKVLPSWLKPELARDNRRDEVTAGLSGMGADTESTGYAGGRLASQIAGTAGVGSALSQMLPAGLARLAPAIESGGFNLGRPAATGLGGRVADAATRAGAGAIVGGTAAGMVDPSTADVGALIGGVAPGAVKAAGMVGGGLKSGAASIAKNVLGMTTGAGSEAIGAAYKAGKSGNQSFVDNMRGNAAITDVIDEAKTALGKIRATRSAEYKSGMAQVSGDKTVMDFTPIIDSLKTVKSIGAFKGQPINKNASQTVNELVDEVSNWASLNPAEFHTPEGLDALKQSIGDIRMNTPYGTSARRAADSVYNAIKSEITAQAPTYAKTMKAYSEASELISEIERSLSLGEKASADTAMRKLQSLMRNNVNTNYGNRLTLAKEIEANGASLLPAIAGQALSSATPRGLQGLAATGAGVAGLTNPAMWGALPFQSPRLMGELARGMGKVSGTGESAVNAMLGNPAISQQLANPAYQGLLSTVPAVTLSR